MHGETIVCLATRRWDSMWREAQQHMSRIAQLNRVLYFEPGRDPDRPVLSELWRNLSNFAAPRIRKVRQNLFIIPSPPSLPYLRRNLPSRVLQHTTPLVASTNAAVLAGHVRRTMRRMKVKSPILWMYEPRQIDLVGKVGEKLVCYYIYDEAADFLANAAIANLLRDYDDRLTKCADVVLACSPWIWRRRLPMNPNTFLVPNAVDFAMFAGATSEEHMPDDIVNLPRPIMGTAGMLDDRIDAELLLRAAERYPSYSLVLVGPDRMPDTDAVRRLRAAPNVHLLGQKDPRTLPAYIRQFDVALIPYVIASHTLPLYPLKLFEYLASGRAVVTTALPEILGFSPVARIAENGNAFVRAIADAVTDYAADRVAARQTVAQENTWDKRVEDIYRALGTHLNRRRESTH